MSESPIQRIIEGIKNGIRHRRYAPGQRLIEADLASEHGAGRGPVREALRVLAGDGVVELIPQKGARVRRLAIGDMADLVPLLNAFLKLTVKLSIDKLHEGGAVPSLEAIMNQMRSAASARDAESFNRAGLAYTGILRRVADNRYLDYIDGKLHADLFHSQTASLVPIDDWAGLLTRYEAMHEALLNRQLERALKLADDHEGWLLSVMHR